MTDVGELRQYLGLSVERDRAKRSITISQELLAEQMLIKFGMKDAKPVYTPLDVSVKFQENGIPADPNLFRQIIGSVMYLMLGSRPDLAAAVSVISQFSVNPSNEHMTGAKRILRYIKAMSKYRLHLGANQE